TVQRAVRLHYRIAKAIDDLPQRRPPRLHHHPRLDIGIHHVDTVGLSEAGRGGTLAAADAAGQADDEGVGSAHCGVSAPGLVQRRPVYVDCPSLWEPPGSAGCRVATRRTIITGPKLPPPLQSPG